MNETLHETILRYGDACEFSISRVRQSSYPAQRLEGPEDALSFWNNHVATSPCFDEMREHLVVVTCDNKLKVTGWHIVSVGTLEECLAHPREILVPVLLNRASLFFLMHNHPSGEASPSRADRELTKRINDAAELLQIRLVDHIITARTESFSFREEGLV